MVSSLGVVLIYVGASLRGRPFSARLGARLGAPTRGADSGRPRRDAPTVSYQISLPPLIAITPTSPLTVVPIATATVNLIPLIPCRKITSERQPRGSQSPIAVTNPGP